MFWGCGRKGGVEWEERHSEGQAGHRVRHRWAHQTGKQAGGRQRHRKATHTLTHLGVFKKPHQVRLCRLLQRLNALRHSRQGARQGAHQAAGEGEYKAACRWGRTGPPLAAPTPPASPSACRARQPGWPHAAAAAAAGSPYLPLTPHPTPHYTAHHCPLLAPCAPTCTLHLKSWRYAPSSSRERRQKGARAMRLRVACLPSRWYFRISLPGREGSCGMQQGLGGA